MIPWFTANMDSSSGLAKALANCLHNKSFAGVGTLPSSRFLGRLMNLIPSNLQKNIYVYGSAKGAKDPGHLGKVDSNQFSEWISNIYPQKNIPPCL